jgi:hypothetical protein
MKNRNDKAELTLTEEEKSRHPEHSLAIDCDDDEEDV